MSLILSTNDEILAAFGARLRTQRLSQNLSQQELARMAGLSTGSIRNLEEDGQVSLDTLVRVARALGLLSEFEALFVPPRHSIARMEQAELAQRRRRAPRRSHP
jgi:transcriptional regulator with XRE-family HTH domain